MGRQPMHTNPTITLPDHDEIVRRLLTVNDEPHMRKGFYPRIAAKAGATLNGRGVAFALRLAVADYMAGGPPSPMNRILEELLPAYVTVLVDDTDVRADAHAALEEARRQRE
ncbi:hypothetical protein ACIQ7D_10490 [Streptomyces sp. NPDC096310]|uniref:hypothetical protein n=1 Tax=Streptomyces sp. NPDC096310 TaxID=3366082 RepID=UPI003808F816